MAPPTQQGARRDANNTCGARHFAAYERAGGDAIPAATSRGRVASQQWAGLAEAALESGARWCVGGHGAVQCVRAAGHCVDAHNVDLCALRGGGAMDSAMGGVSGKG